MKLSFFLKGASISDVRTILKHHVSKYSCNARLHSLSFIPSIIGQILLKIV